MNEKNGPIKKTVVGHHAMKQNICEPDRNIGIGKNSLIENANEVNSIQINKRTFSLKGVHADIYKDQEQYIVIGVNDDLIFLKNGDIYVHGKLIENDKEIVEGFRAFLRGENNQQTTN